MFVVSRVILRLFLFFSRWCVQGLLPAAEEKQGCRGDVGRLFVFAVMWSLGAVLELDDRAKMEAFIKVCVCVCENPFCLLMHFVCL